MSRQSVWAGLPFNPEGEWIGHEAWARDNGQWIPTEADEAYVASLMKPCYEVGKIAGWIAPPRVGINGNAFDFEYVKFSDDPYARL